MRKIQKIMNLKKIGIISGKDMERSLSKKFVKPSHSPSQVEYKHLNIINQEDCVICADSLEVRSDNESKCCVNEF